MCCKPFGVVIFDLWPLLQGQMGSLTFKVDFSCLLLVLEVSDVHPTYRKSCAVSLLDTAHDSLKVGWTLQTSRTYIKRDKDQNVKKYPKFDLKVPFTSLQIADWGAKFDMVLAINDIYPHAKFKSSRYNSLQVIPWKRWFLLEKRPLGLCGKASHQLERLILYMIIGGIYMYHIH